MPTITEKIQSVRNTIVDEGEGSPTGERIGREAIAALKKGMESDEWVTFMRNFATTDEQLTRLSGREQAFMNSTWGVQLLAYVVASGPCTENTGLRLVTDDLDQSMKDILDAGV